METSITPAAPDLGRKMITAAAWLSLFVLPILVPVAVWLAARKSEEFVRQAGRRATFWQLGLMACLASLMLSGAL
ncbi:MAG: DUF4870 domain-containing protein, partial [Fimbriimonadaceae bacterium]|nr:DUF4870 domain-containing protein [Fimbriimonadaceae bacterium]